MHFTINYLQMVIKIIMNNSLDKNIKLHFKKFVYLIKDLM
jgi:hypothetical protein